MIGAQIHSPIIETWLRKKIKFKFNFSSPEQLAQVSFSKYFFRRPSVCFFVCNLFTFSIYITKLNQFQKHLTHLINWDSSLLK